MKISVDINIIIKAVLALIMWLLAVYIIAGAGKAGLAGDEVRRTNAEDVINKALSQCYALEGYYPYESGFADKMAEYGVVLNEDKYEYNYSFNTSLTGARPEIEVRLKPLD